MATTADAIRASLNRLAEILERTEVRYPGIDHAFVRECVKAFIGGDEVEYDSDDPARIILAPKIAWVAFSQFKREVGRDVDFDKIAEAMEV